MAVDISRKDLLKLGAAALAASGAGKALAASPKAEPMPTRPVKTLIKGADVLTCEKGAADLPGHDVLIEGGKIVAVAPSIPAAGAEVVDAKGMALMPGFADGFRHNWETYANGRILKTNNSYPRYYDTFYPLAPGIMTPEDLYFSEYLGGLEAINSGYTNVVNYAHAHDTLEKLEAGIQGYLASGAGGTFCWTLENERPKGWAPKSLAEVTAHLQQPIEDRIYKRAEMVRAKYFAAADADLLPGFSNGPTLGKPTAQAVDHFRKMRAVSPNVIIEHYTRPAVLPPEGTMRTWTQAYEAGLFQPDLMITHALTLTDDELILMAKSGAATASAPCVEMSYDRTAACIHGRAHKYGVPAAFGFDAPMEAVRDPFEMMRMSFAVLFKTQESWAISETLNSDDILAFKTRVGAQACKKGAVAGTITPGKRADLVLVRIDDYKVPTNGTLADRVVNFCALGDIDSVWVGGKRRKKDGKMIGVDWARLKAQRTAIDERIWAAMGNPSWGLKHG